MPFIYAGFWTWYAQKCLALKKWVAKHFCVPPRLPLGENLMNNEQ